MKENVVRVMNVSKRYDKFQALNDVSLTIQAGRIYGLIGKNGAGKTTLMRLLAGLSFPTSGSIELFGHSGDKNFTAELKRVGTLIEYPGMNGNMTALENLKLHRIMRGVPEKSKGTELLGMVGLSGVGKKKVKDFSLGMRQRLGIAIAMIGNPELLILDEPVNGLDPVGVVEIRKLIKQICEERHITVLISSHNLPEMFQTATDYIIIDQGEIKQTLTLEELEDKCRHYLEIECEEPQRLASMLEDKLGTNDYRVLPDNRIRVYDRIDDIKEISKMIYENGIIPTKLAKEGETLENYFLSVIGGDSND